MTTPMMWTLGRYVVDGQADVAAVTKLQDKTWFVPLSKWKAGMTSAPRAKVDPSGYPKMTNEDLDDAEKFFTTMNEVMRRNPPLKQDHALLGWFREINLHPEQRFDWSKLDEPTKKGLTRAVKDALTIIAEREKTFAPLVNGWVPAIMPGDQSDLPLYHAATTKLGLLYSQKEVSTYHVGFMDSDGKPLSGTQRYVIELSPPPPVQAFWSLTMYHADTKFLVANKINRYSVGDRTRGLKAKEDGSLAITISANEPSDPDAKANWLPAPKGAFFMVLREYSPKPAVLNGGWQPPEIRVNK
jgi:hypothetical protein